VRQTNQDNSNNQKKLKSIPQFSEHNKFPFFKQGALAG
jgi:hypothetical protein